MARSRLLHIAILAAAIFPVFAPGQTLVPTPRPKQGGIKPRQTVSAGHAVEGPEPLPQEPGDDRRGTDARDAGLKGSVSSVLKSTERLAGGKTQASPLKKESEHLYDEKGNLVKEILYIGQSEPGLITVYGFIDKLRVSNSKTYGLWSLVGGDPIAVKGADSRFETKYEFRYDENGRLTEWASYNSAGEPESKRTYTYTGNTREQLSVDTSGKVSVKWAEIFDQRGNPTQMTVSHPDGRSAPFTNYYTYVSFDTSGNWTKRTVYTKDPGARAIPYNRSVEYRKIAYYK